MWWVSEPKHHQCRQTLRILQWNADGLATKQHELRLRLKDDRIDIIQETKLLPKDTTPSFSGFCAIRTGRPTNLIGGELLTLNTDDLVFQKKGGLPPSARTPHSPGPALPSEMGHNPHLCSPHPIRWHYGHARFRSPANGPPDHPRAVTSMPTPLCGTLTSRATHVVNSRRIGWLLTPSVSSTTKQRRYSNAQRAA